MRQSSALFDRLDKRFARMENIGKAPVRGYERLDRFIRNFQARMKKLESMSKFREMDLFKRMPSFASNDPWGSMGGWSFAKDMTYLEWIPHEEEQIEEVEAPRVSAWGTADKASGNKDLRVNSPWLNTPYTPARVSKGSRVSGVSSSARKAAPLQRLLSKAAVSEHYSNDKKQVRESLPPMLARSPKIIERLEKAEKRSNIQPQTQQRHKQKRERFSPVLSSAKTLKTPKTVQEQRKAAVHSSQNRIQSNVPSVNDYQVLVQQLVQEIQDPKNSDKASVQKLQKRVKQIKKEMQRVERSRPLQSILDREIQSLDVRESSFGRESVLPSRASSKPSKKNFVQEKEEIVAKLVSKIEQVSSSGNISQEKLVTTIQKQVQIADQKIRKLQSTAKIAPKKNSSVELTQIVYSSLSPEILDGIESSEKANLSRTTKTAVEKISAALNPSQTKRSQIVEMIERLEKVQEISEQSVLPKFFQREASIERKVVTELVTKIEKLGRSTDISDEKLAETIEQHVQIAEKKIQKLQSSRKMRNSSPDLVNTILPAFAEEGSETSPEAEQKTVSPWFSRKEVEDKLSTATKGRVARPQILELVERLEKTQKESLPTISGREAAVERKVVTELVTKIEKLGRSTDISDEKLAETVEQHVQIANQKIRKLQSSRKNKTAFMDMVDIQPTSEVEMDAQVSESSAPTSSPWFSRREESRNIEKKQKLSATQQAASRLLKENTENPTRPEIIAKSFGLTKKRAQQVVAAIQSNQGASLIQEEKAPQKRYSQPSLLSYVEKRELRQENLESRAPSVTTQGERAANRSTNSLVGAWERATAPIHLPEWKSIGTEAGNPLSSGRTWRLEPKRRAMYPTSALQETFLDPSRAVSNSEQEISEQQIQASERRSPWLSHKNQADFEPQMFKGTPDLSAASRIRSSAKISKAKSISLDAGYVQKKSATWLEPNRTVLLDNGVVIDAKQASMMGIKPKKKSPGNLPLQWTLEGLQLESNNSALPGWAKRASGKPQFSSKSKSVDQEFVTQVTQASSIEDVVEAILDRSKKEFVGNATLAKSTVQAIERIRKESHRALETKLVEGAEKRIGAKLRRSAKHRALNFTGLKPMAVGQTSQREESPDKISRLAKQLENLVLLAEDNQRDEARQGVRMAEDSHAAVAEGHAAGGGREDERDPSIDIEALAQEVLFAFEQELSLRKMRSFDESTNPDVWW